MLLHTADSFGHSAKGQHWRSAGLTDLVCAEGEHTQKGVSGVLCHVLSKHMFCLVRALIIYYVSGVAAVCCRHTLLQFLQTHTHTHTPRLHTVCVCDTVLLRLATLSTVTYTSYNSVQHEHISPHISVLPASNASTY